MRYTLILLLLVLCASCKNDKVQPDKRVEKKPTIEEKSKYDKLIKEGWNLYDEQKYLASAERYSQAFKTLGDKGSTTDRYNAACSWALANQVDSSFAQLFRISKNGNYTSYDHLTKDTDLLALHADKRWPSLLDMVKKNKEVADAKLDKGLVAILDTIYQDDQSLRRLSNEISEKYGRDSEELKSHWKSIEEKDSVNLIKVQKILDERGWLGQDVVGGRGNSALFLVIQHASIEVQQKYLPMMREAVKKKNAQPSSLALLEDRVALRTGKRQIYGSQIGRDPETGESYVSPIEDPENVDKRRAEVGLGPLADYASNWNIIWSVEKHKARTEKLESEKR